MRPASTSTHVDPAWLTEAFREQGILHNGRVASLTSAPIGAGMLGESARFVIGYDGPDEAAPTSVVGKFAPDNAKSRQLAADYGLYLGEVHFYREIAPSSKARLAKCYVAEITPDRKEFSLILEDLSGARQIGQLDGCPVEDAAEVLRQIARLHAPYWDDASLHDRPWLAFRTRHLVNAGAIYQKCFPIFAERFKDLLAPEYMKICAGFAEHMEAFVTRPLRHFTIQHKDLRLDNILFDVAKTKDAVILDWQSVTIGSGLLDVAYFICTSLTIEDRRAHETKLVRGYFDELHRLGVRDYGWDECWQDYRLQSFQAIYTAVIASANTTQTTRSDAVFAAMAQRGATMIRDLDVLAAG